MATATARHWCTAALAAFVSTFAVAALAAVPVHIVKTDLKPLIRAGMDSPVQFAVLVPHAVSATSDGSWSTADGRATWRYAVDVPTAVSLSFHATKSSLPDDATLVVRGARTTTGYRARDMHRGELWSRIQPGEALQFTLTVAAEDRSKVAFNIVSLQAGYRSLGPGVKDHPYYLKLRGQPAASGNAACVTNYMCEITTANTPPGAATVALTVENLYQCSGSLINDVPGDNTPYLLTARHCETGQLGGGNPGAASTVTVYWDATTACGAALGTIYAPGIPIQTGAQTMVEQQDAWLIQLDVNPVVSDAQFAGFDASGGAVQGGYTIHHAEGYDKQFAGWFGQAAAVTEIDAQGTTYVSNFWETVNQIGNIAPGASGSGLIDQNNHLVGSLTFGRTTSDPSGYGSCPLANPPAPNGTNGVADFTSLAAVWNSTADASSSTGATTLKSVLDPDNTGILAVPSTPVAAINFTASAEAISVGQSVTLTWSAPGATQCTAGGGVSGDGWSGKLAASGNQAVTEATASVVTYTLSCAYAGGRTARTSTVVTWLGPTPVVTLTGSTGVWTSTPATLTWTSNIAPCSLTGGGLSLNDLPASGTTTTTQATAADVNYKLVCGNANQNAFYVWTVAYVTPSLVLSANGTDRLLGQTFFLVWSTYADSCTPSGGAPNDGWGTAEFTGFYATSGEPFYPNVTTLGTYTYTLNCSSGSISLTQNVTVTFENNAPYATASLSSPSVTFSDSPADWVTLKWSTNLSGCGLTTNPIIGVTYDTNASYPQGTATIAPDESGTYQLSVNCSGNPAHPPVATVTSPTQTLIVLPPPPPTATITFNPSNVAAGQSFTAAWSSTYADDCLLTGGIAGGGWGGSVQYVPSTGYDNESGPAGNYTFGITCQSIDPNTAPVSTQADLTIVSAQSSSGGSASSDGGHGGGGAIGVLELALLGVLRALRRAAPVPAGRRHAA
jgi:lysyl endopeptidase